MISAASASGDCAFGSDSDVNEWEACVRYPWENSARRDSILRPGSIQQSILKLSDLHQESGL